MNFKVGAVGNVCKGHVLDVNVKPFERALQDYDSQLYVKWNPKKLRGWGCWEIRRRPNEKRIKDIVEFKGSSFVVVDYVENDLENHILDLPYLNYLALLKLKSMDTWAVNRDTWVHELEYRERVKQQEIQDKREKDMRYAAKQIKHEIRDFKEMILSGLNPNQIADYWGKKQGQISARLGLKE